MAVAATPQPVSAQRPVSTNPVPIHLHAPSRRTIVLGVGVLAFLVLVYGGYRLGWGWTGFSDNTLWEWFQLLILPVTLALGGMWFNMQQSHASRLAAEQLHQNDLQIADNAQQEAALDAYLDHMADLLLARNLRACEPGSGPREVAHARTLTTVWRVGKYRKGLLLKF